MQSFRRTRTYTIFRADGLWALRVVTDSRKASLEHSTDEVGDRDWFPNGEPEEKWKIRATYFSLPFGIFALRACSVSSGVSLISDWVQLCVSWVRRLVPVMNMATMCFFVFGSCPIAVLGDFFAIRWFFCGAPASVMKEEETAAENMVRKILAGNRLFNFVRTWKKVPGMTRNDYTPKLAITHRLAVAKHSAGHEDTRGRDKKKRPAEWASTTKPPAVRCPRMLLRNPWRLNVKEAWRRKGKTIFCFWVVPE